MASIIAEMETEGLSLPDYLATHPATDARAERARANAQEQDDTTPVLSDTDWAALQAVCS